MDTWTNNPIIAIIIVVAVVVVLFFKFFGKKNLKPSSFKPRLFTKTIYDDFKNKVNVQGLKFKGNLNIGFHKIAIIEKYCFVKGRLPVISYEAGSKNIEIADKDQSEEYEFMVIRAKSNNVFYRLFGLKKMFFVLNSKEIELDKMQKRVFLPSGVDLISYGNVWVNHDYAIEYINDISIKRMNEQMMTQLENYPDRIVHLEAELTKKLESARVYTELERAKYDKTKYGEDTKIL